MKALATLVPILAALTLASTSEAHAAEPRWNRTMKDLYQTLSELMTDVSSDARYSAPENQSRIAKNAGKLSKLAHDLKGSVAKAPDQDPSIAILGDLFAEESARASKSFKQGNKVYARDLLRGMSGYCIACHTRTQSGPSFSSLPLNPTGAPLKPAERGAFFAATRQYDRALEELNQAIAAPQEAGPRSGEWTHAVRNALAIAVRVKRDPDLAIGIVDKVIATKGSPMFFVQDARAWRQTLLDWKNEPARTAVDEEGLHAEAVRLLTKAHETQKYPVDRSADILYLRASAATHDLLQKAPDGKRAAEAFFMAGVAYEVLRPFRLAELHEVYYEGCVRKAPHTPLAEGCVRRLEASIYDGFTGSAGTDVPADVLERLKRVAKLAEPLPSVNGAAPQ